MPHIWEQAISRWTLLQIITRLHTPVTYDKAGLSAVVTRCRAEITAPYSFNIKLDVVVTDEKEHKTSKNKPNQNQGFANNRTDLEPKSKKCVRTQTEPNHTP